MEKEAQNMERLKPTASWTWGKYSTTELQPLPNKMNKGWPATKSSTLTSGPVDHFVVRRCCRCWCWRCPSCWRGRPPGWWTRWGWGSPTKWGQSDTCTTRTQDGFDRRSPSGLDTWKKTTYRVKSHIILVIFAFHFQAEHFWGQEPVVPPSKYPISPRYIKICCLY